MGKDSQPIREILEQFKEYLETEEAKQHLKTMEKEKAEVKELMRKLAKMDFQSPEFTEWVLYGLLPYSKSRMAKRVSLFPAFMNIKLFFKEYKYTEEEWNLIANKIYNLCKNFQDNPKMLPELIREFVGDKYSRRLQCGSITPILWGLNDSFPIVNNRTRRSVRSINLILERREKTSQKLDEYTNNIKKIDTLVRELDSDLLRNRDYEDLLVYWYDSEILSEEKRAKKKESEEEETAQETENGIRSELVDYRRFLENVDLEKGFDFEPHSLGDPQRIRISQIVNKCDKADWVLPHFQRYFDWKKADVRDLWEAIFHDYYIGSFLLWETNRNPELGIQPILGVQKSKEELSPLAIILDGQQRMTSLYYAIKAPKFALRGSKLPLYLYVNFYAYFNKNVDNEIVEMHSKKFSRTESFQRMLFPLFELEKHSKWVDDFEDFLLEQEENAETVRKIRRIINNKLSHMWEGFEIPFVSLPESMELPEVTDIFEGINSKGKPLSVFDLLIARLYKYDIELKKMWDATLKNYPNILRYFKHIKKVPIYILQALSLLYDRNSSCKRADILNIYSKIYENSERDFEEDWDEVSDYMNEAIEKLENMRDGFGVRNEREIPFAPMIPVLTAMLKFIDSQENKADCYKKLSKWYWSAVFTNAYSSAADSQMTSDFKDMKAWVENDLEIPRTVNLLTRELPNLYFRDIQSKSNAKYRGVMSLIALQGAKDFATSQSLENARANDKDHLFPKSFKFGFGSNKSVNSILNITWMSDETNRKIKRCKVPSTYIKEFIKEKYNGNESQFLNILKTHFIGQKAYSSLLSDKFEEFLNLREKAIINMIEEFVGCQIGKSEETLVSPKRPFTNKIIFINLLRSCEGHIYWLDKYFSKKGLEFLSQSVETEKVNKIKIIMAIDTVDERLRKLFKDFKKEMLNKDIDCELRVMTDSKIKSQIHDRFIICKNNSYNIPSPDIIARGQLSEISKSRNKKELSQEFNNLWQSSKDIVTDWNSIKELIVK